MSNLQREARKNPLMELSHDKKKPRTMATRLGNDAIAVLQEEAEEHTATYLRHAWYICASDDRNALELRDMRAIAMIRAPPEDPTCMWRGRRKLKKKAAPDVQKTDLRLQTQE